MRISIKKINSCILALFMAISLTTVSAFADDDYVASVTIEGTTTYYTSFNDAYNAARGSVSSTYEGGNTTAYTLTLLADCQLTSSTKMYTDLTIDLNGYTLSTDIYYFCVCGGGTLTIVDSSDNQTGKVSIESYHLVEIGELNTTKTFTDAGSVVIDGVTIEGTSNSTEGIVLIQADDGSSVSVTLTDVTATSNFSKYIVSDQTGCSYTLALDVDGGSYETSQNGFYFYGTLTSGSTMDFDDVTITTVECCVQSQGATVTIDDCTFTSTGTEGWYNSAIATSNNGTVTVNSGTYSGYYGAYVFSSGGTIIINGGTFTGTSAVLKADNDTYDNDSDDEGSAIIVYDGTFDGEISIATETDSTNGETTLTIYHGEFTDEDAGDYIVTASYMDEDGNKVNTYVVSETDEDGETVTYVHALVLIEAVDATCTEDGNIEYYYCTYDSCESPYFVYDEETETYTSVSEGDVLVSALGHDYDFDNRTVVWSDDYTTLTVTWTCVAGDDEYTVTTTNITSEENEDGTITYTAEVEGPDGDDHVFTTSVEKTTSDTTNTTDTTDTTDSVDTGDASHVYAWLAMLLAAGFVLIGKGVYTIKRNR